MAAAQGWRFKSASAIAVVLVALVFCSSRQSAVSSENLVRFPSLDSETELTAFLFKPDGQAPFPAIVFLHGCSGLGLGGGISAGYAAWARVLRARGYAVLLVDSAGPRGVAATCGRGPHRTVMYRDRPKDAYGALAFLQAQPFVQPDRIGLLGWSQGGGIVLLSVVTQSIGRPRPPPRHDFKAAAAFYPSACSEALQSTPYTEVKPGSWATEIPLLVLQGEADNWTRAAPCVAFLDGLRQRGLPVEVKLYPGALHSFDAPDLARRERPQHRTSSGVIPLVGTDPAAREDALQRLPAFFDRYLME